MKTPYQHYLILLFLINSISSCKKPPVAFVETGTINNKIFKSGGPFNPIHNALGVISDSCILIPNAYKFNNKYYVFDKGIIPPKIFVKGAKKILTAIQNTTWLPDTLYKIEYDAMVCQNNMMFYTRQKENPIQRRKAIIFGQNVYEIKDELYTENYNVFGKYHNRLVGASNNVNLFKTLNISPKDYTVNTGRTDLIFNDSTGYFNLNTSKPTPQNSSFDKIKFLPNNTEKTKYLFRYLYYQHPQSKIDSFFNEKGVKNEKAWTKYLRDEIYPSFFPEFIEGYNCTCAKSESNLKSNLLPPPVGSYSPPLPLNANTKYPISQ